MKRLILFFFIAFLIPTIGKPSINYAGISFDQIKKTFNAQNAWGLHTTVDLKNCDSELIRSADAIKNFVIQLCDLIDMSRFGDPIIVNFGQKLEVAGYSMVQLIETSNISGHFVNIDNSAYIDVFSCKLYDPYVVAAFTKTFFKGDHYVINILLRQ
ncbi:MAG: S-adenosylmethionine decarboxylase [Candidatus Babeliales bacterium]